LFSAPFRLPFIVSVSRRKFVTFFTSYPFADWWPLPLSVDEGLFSGRERDFG
jgi:hypothetical protein